MRRVFRPSLTHSTDGGDPQIGCHAHQVRDRNRKPHYVYNFLGIKPEQHFVSSSDLRPGKFTVGMDLGFRTVVSPARNAG